MRTLKLLFTEKYFRKAFVGMLKYRFLALPGIRHITGLIGTYKMYQKIKDMDQWDLYVETRRIQNNSNRTKFVTALIQLSLSIMAKGKNEELFNQAKSDVLSNELINEPEYGEFKKWVESIDVTETDYSRVDEIINSLTEKVQ